MANRHLSRSIAMQTLFEWDFNGCNNSKIEDILNRNIKEFGPGLENDNLTRMLVKGVLKNQKKLDQIIEKAAPEWPVDQIARVDRNVLRLGLFELLFGDRSEVPPKVAINEAIELAKNFGGDSSGRFVNGVLGTVYKELGEPGKDETTKKKFEGDISQLPVEYLAGGLIWRKEGDLFLFGLVHDVFGYWTLSKGHIEQGEDIKEGARRELEKELGIAVTIGKELGTNEYVASDPEKGKIRKRVVYFLAGTEDSKLRLAPSGGLDDALWFREEELKNIKTYPDIKPLLEKAITILHNN